MKRYLPFIIVGSLAAIMLSCSKSGSIPNTNKDEFGNITQFDSVLAYVVYNVTISAPPDSVYYYFKYNSEGQPVSGIEKSLSLSSATGFYFFSYSKDTLIYLDNRTIEKISFPNLATDALPTGKTLYYFNNGYITQKIDYITSDGLQYYPKDTSSFNYNNSHQLISIITSDGTIYSTETDYVYGTTTIEDSTYTIDALTKNKVFPPTGSQSTYTWTFGTEPNPYYGQEWLKMWLIYETLSPFVMRL